MTENVHHSTYGLTADDISLPTSPAPGLHIEDHVLTLYDGRAESVAIPEGVHTIGEEAFKACVSLKRISLPHSLHTIMAGAFKGCRKLEEITIPASVRRVGDYAFHRCHSLKQISLPPSVEELGDCAFLYCDSLTRISMPGVRRLGKQAFVNDILLKELVISRDLQEDCLCDVFTSCGTISSIAFPDGETFTFPNTVEVVAGEMDVPSLVHAIAVDVLRMMELDGRRLVKFLTNLKHVEIPEGIQSIGKSCFFDKRGILSVKLPASLKDIESRAFRNCISLETVTFGNDTVAVHEDAFKNCTSLKHICLVGGSMYTFQGISGLSEGETPPLVHTVHRQVMGNFLLSGTVLLKYLGSESRVAVPDGVTAIAEEAFAGNEAVDRVLLPDSLLEIGAFAFRDCLLLQTIEFPEHVSRIGAGAFENCVKLIRAILPPCLSEIEPGTFKRCRVLREIALGPCLKTIGQQAFYQCVSLKEVSFPESLTSIGEMAFYRCGGLKEIRLLPSVTHVGNLAFGESGVKKVHMSGDSLALGSDIFSRCLRLRTLVLEPGVRHVPDKLAYGCTSLKYVSLPDSLESVGRHAFEYTPFLQNTQDTPNSGDIQNSQDMPNTQDISENGPILWDGRNLSGDVALPETIKIIAGGAFYENTSLTRIHIPDSVTWIGPAAFKGCECLAEVFWPSGIDTIQEEVFSGCSMLESLNTHAPLRSVGKRAFFRCENLKNLSLKDFSQIHTLGDEALWGCKALELRQLSSLARVGERAFEKTCFPDIVNHILVSGQNFSGEVSIPEGVLSIAPYAFFANPRITSVLLPSSLSHIGEGAFWGCGALETVVFSDTPCRLGSRAFEKCISLKSVTICAEQAGDKAFAFCTSLFHVELKGLKVLKQRLFEGCRQLKVCVCPEAEVVEDLCFSGCGSLKAFDFSRLRRIGSYSFQDCDGLTTLNLNHRILLMPHAFEDCGNVEEIQFSETDKDNPPGATAFEAASLREYAFSGCTRLTNVVWKGICWKMETYRDILSDHIPETVRLIYHSALSCFQIEKEEILTGYRGQGRIVSIPRGIRRIQAEVFRDVLMLKEIQIPETVEYIGARAFHGTAWLERQRQANPLVVVNQMLLDGSCCQGEVTVPLDVRLVCGWAFANGLGIRRINFLSHQVKVEEYAFRNCIYLKEMALPGAPVIRFNGIADRNRRLPPVAMQAVMDSLNCFKTDEDCALAECTGNISDLLVADGITAIKDHVFQDGNLLSRIRLPHTVTSIGKCAFSGCKWLTSVENASGVRRIEAMAFSGCGRLETIELSQNLRFLGPRAFEHCTSLKEILIPEGVEEIPDRAFFRCHSLRRILFPSTLKKIGKEAFAFCKNLDMPVISDHVTVEQRAFAGCSFAK